MAKTPVIVLFSLATICLLSLFSFAYAAGDTFFVEGKVYCDTCRVEFETRLSEPIKGATVNLECRNRTTEVVTYSREGVTNELGKYRISVEGDHEEEICEVKAIKSSREDCNDPMDAWSKARVVLTTKDGVMQPTRYANGLGYRKKEAVSGCAEVLKELGFVPLN